jgi:hypothetical protein
VCDGEKEEERERESEWDAPIEKEERRGGFRFGEREGEERTVGESVYSEWERESLN